jgi:integrase
MRGCIVKRGKTSWAVVLDLPRDSQTGQRRQKWYTHKTRAEADRHLTHIKAAMAGGTYKPPTTFTVAEYLTQWLRDAVEPRVGAVTLRDYRAIVQTHLLPAFGRDLLAAVSPDAIDAYLAEKQRAGLAASTRHKHYRVVSAAFAQAVRWGLLTRNPATMATPPRVVARDFTPWDEEEVRMFLGEARRTSRHHTLYLTALGTGLRMGELLGLRWQDLDLPLARLTVSQAFYRLGRDPAAWMKTPKTRASRRTVALPAAVVEALRAHQQAQEEITRLLGADYQNQGLVFCQPTGKPLHAHNLSQKDFQRIIRRAGLRRIRFHDLRHCHASHLARAGVSVKVAQERLGHASPMMTLRVYTHTLTGEHEDAARRIGERLFGHVAAGG